MIKDLTGRHDVLLLKNSAVPSGRGQYAQKPSARLCAAYAVLHVLRDGEQLETALTRQPDYSRLEARDRAFCTPYCGDGISAHGDRFDAAFKNRSCGAPPRLCLMRFLRTGAAQTFYSSRPPPPRRPLGESVELLKSSVKTRAYSGMVNAVLRRVAEQGPGLALTAPPSANIPGWIRNTWETAYGKPAMRKMALQLAAEPPLDIHVRSDAASWAEKLGGEMLSGWMVRLPKSGLVTAFPGFEGGAWWVAGFRRELACAKSVEK